MSPEEKARRTLGCGVHEQALARLFELWPSAYVSVRHVDTLRDGIHSKTTFVKIYPRPPRKDGFVEGGHVVAAARCRLDCDQWVRSKGIGLAFNRALKRVKRVVNAA